MVTCSKCTVWEEEENSPGYGACKRHAPSPKVGADTGSFIGHASMRSLWPYTRSFDGCYEGIEGRSIPAKPTVNQNTTPPDTLGKKSSFNDLVEKRRNGRQ